MKGASRQRRFSLASVGPLCLCNLDVHEIAPRKIKALRERAHVSQAVFAAVLNTSVSTVQKWEIGDKKPSGPSLKLLNLIERKGLEVLL